MRLRETTIVAQERALVAAVEARGARRPKSFLRVVQSAVDRYGTSPYSPSTHDGQTTATLETHEARKPLVVISSLSVNESFSS
jgi:hypothetical protein